MTTSRHLDLSELKTTRSNLYKLNLYFFGLTPTEKKPCVADVYEKVFKNSLDQTLYHELKKLAEQDHAIKIYQELNTREKRKLILDYLTENIMSIDDQEIQQELKRLVKEEANNLKGLLAVESLKQYQDEAKKNLTDKTLQDKSQIIWKTNIRKMRNLVSYRESFIPRGWRDLVLEIINFIGMIIGINFFITYGTAKKNDIFGFSEENNFFMTFGFFIIIVPIAFILDRYALRKIEIKPSFDAFDNVITNQFEQFSENHLTKKSKAVFSVEQGKVVSISPVLSKVLESVALEEKDENKIEKPLKRYQLSCLKTLEIEEENKVEKKEEKGDITVGKNKYVLMDYSSNCFFRLNKDQLAEKFKLDEKLITKIENAVGTRRVHSGFSLKSGVTKVDESELAKFPFGWKLKIPRQDERPELELRSATNEEKAFGIETVFSPRAIKKH